MDNHAFFGSNGEMSATQKTRSDIWLLEQELGLEPNGECELNDDSTYDATQQRNDRIHYAVLLQLKEQRIINQKLLVQCQQLNMLNAAYSTILKDIKVGVWLLLAVVTLPVAFALFWAFVQAM